jgi:hypothetical protein
MISGKLDHEYDTEEGELFELEIEYSYVPYTPAKLTADPYYSEPADGGGCEEIIFKVVGYRQYDENNDVTQDLPKLTPEQSKKLTDKFDKMVSDSQRLQNYFQDLCSRDAERSREPDYE